MFIGFEDDTLGQLPARFPAGAPRGDEIVLAGPRDQFPNVQVVGAPMGATDLRQELVDALRKLDSQALYITNQDVPSIWFASRRIPHAQDGLKQVATFNGLFVGSDGEANVSMSGLAIGSESNWVRLVIKPDEVKTTIVGPSEDSDLQFTNVSTVPVAGGQFFSVRATFDPSTETVDLAVTVGDQTVRSSDSYAGGGRLDGIVIYVSSGDGPSGGIIVDDFKLQPPIFR
jgi:hypothetical protein